jgi:hypothetical protein
MKYLLYILIIFTISSCEKEDIIMPQIKQTQTKESSFVKKTEKKLKAKKKRKFKK